MPIYEYRCTSCGKEFEEWVKGFDASEQEPCPVCGAEAFRIISRTSFVLEGSGWYVTEYGNRKTNHESGAGAPNEGHGTQNSDADSSSDASSESTTASATDSQSPSPAATSGTDTAPASSHNASSTGTAA